MRYSHRWVLVYIHGKYVQCLFLVYLSCLSFSLFVSCFAILGSFSCLFLQLTQICLTYYGLWISTKNVKIIIKDTQNIVLYTFFENTIFLVIEEVRYPVDITYFVLFLSWCLIRVFKILKFREKCFYKLQSLTHFNSWYNSIKNKESCKKIFS